MFDAILSTNATRLIFKPLNRGYASGLGFVTSLFVLTKHFFLYGLLLWLLGL
jgi:hypothetical protein